MKRLRKWRATTAGIWTLLLLALVLFTGASVAAARAALNIQSEVYSAEVELKDIGVTLMENEAPVSRRNFVAGGGYVWDEEIGSLLVGMLDQSEGILKVGYPYQERFAVTNSGRIDQYLRVRVYRYWSSVDAQGHLPG